MRMVVFLSVFMTLYGSLHFYALMKTGRTFGFHKGLTLPLALFMVVMVVCPILVRVVERQGMESLARVLAYAGYTWMGFLFLFVAAAAVLDLYRLLIYVGAHTLGGPFSKWTLSSKALFFLAFFASIMAGIYGLMEGGSIRTEHVVDCIARNSKKVGSIKDCSDFRCASGIDNGKERAFTHFGCGAVRKTGYPGFHGRSAGWAG